MSVLYFLTFVYYRFLKTIKYLILIETTFCFISIFHMFWIIQKNLTNLIENIFSNINVAKSWRPLIILNIFDFDLVIFSSIHVRNTIIYRTSRVRIINQINKLIKYWYRIISYLKYYINFDIYFFIHIILIYSYLTCLWRGFWKKIVANFSLSKLNTVEFIKWMLLWYGK